MQHWFKTIIASAGAGICFGTGLLAILQGQFILGIPIILFWFLNMWVLFKPVKEELPRILIEGSGVGVSIGLGIYAMLIDQKLFGSVILLIGLANLLFLLKEVER
jgi:hypothetical protein